ncbi:META domain-containing protein [Streptomyces sp. 3211.6]|uniref:META domain-containing protein n=1 Tax=Streptomyces sp. 3211.6 TaxID=1938845 RepID=UPI000EABA41D|nr:META domain-containing protein [Streptomyces sp. 3211.6]
MEPEAARARPSGMRILRHPAGPAAAGLVLVLAALTGCTAAPQGGSGIPVTGRITATAPEPAAAAPLTVTDWTVTALSGAPVPAGAAGRARFTLAPDGTAGGSLGCNRFSAPAAVTGDTVTFGPVTSTRMACEGPPGEVERTLTGLFGAGPLAWKIHGRTLTLTAADGRTLTAEAASAAE